MSFIYADHAATTRVSDSVLAAMRPFLQEQYGNPSALYGIGREAKHAVEAARKQVADLINAEPQEIVFTSCGTESDNWAIKSTARSQRAKGKTHIITTNIEHHAVLHSCAALEKEGFTVTYLPVDENGYVTPQQVEEAITPETALVTVMYANNEIGTIQPIREIGEVCRRHKVLFHTDAVQAVGHLPIDVKAENIDMLSLSGHKLSAPKGVGALYRRKGIVLPPYLDGGAQESNRRAGTENTASIVGLGQAAADAAVSMEQRQKKISAMRDKLIAGLSKIHHARLNGGLSPRLDGNVNFSFAGIEGESLLLLLEQNGIAASSGSACTSGSLDPSHVLLAIGLPHEIAHGSLRLTLGEDNTDEDIEKILTVVPQVVARLRDMSPTWEKYKED